MGRWSRDPAEEGGGENVYSFVRNNGINYSDYIGMWYIDTDAWVSGKRHIWIAEAGDKLADLATKHYGASEDDRYCLWPVGEWDTGYPEKVMPCDRYDAGNLNPNPDPSEKTVLGITLETQFKNDDQAMFGFQFALVRGEEVPWHIKRESREGKLPISFLIMSGHAGRRGIMSGLIRESKSNFTVNLLKLLDQPPSFSRAREKKGPLRCWFTRTASVIFSGCSSKEIAEPFAREILRKGAFAWGTNQAINGDFTGQLWWNYYKPGSHPSLKGFQSSGDWKKAPVWELYGGAL